MKIPYKQEPDNFVSMDHEQLITGDPDHVRDLIIGMVMSTDHDLALADLMIGRIREAKKAIESKYKGPVERAHQAHKKLTKERGQIITGYEWAENLLKDKMKGYNMEADRKAWTFWIVFPCDSNCGNRPVHGRDGQDQWHSSF